MTKLLSLIPRRYAPLFAALWVVALVSYAFAAMPGHNGVVSPAGGGGSTAMQTAKAAACSNCWFDAFDATVPTINSVVYACAGTPCPGVPSTAPSAAQIAGSQGISSLTSQWVGAWYNTDTNEAGVNGGGHMSYCGNEWYVFNLNTLKWRRASAPSSITTPTSYNCSSGGAATMPDGQPAASHNYSTFSFVHSGLVYAITLCGAQAGGCTGNIFSLDSTTLNPTAYGTMVQRASCTPVCDFDNLAAIDPNTGILWTTSNSQGLYKMSSLPGGTLSCQGTCNDQQLGFHMTAAIQPGAFFVGVGCAGDVGGNTGLSVWDLTTGNISTRSFTGDSTIPTVCDPGFVWSGTHNKFIGWNGGTTLYTLSKIGGTWTFAVATLGGSNVVNPACSDNGGGTPNCTGTHGVQANGTYGRFVYDPTDDLVCIIANSYLDHTYCRRLDSI